MASYLTLAQFKTLSLMPGSFIDAIEAVTPGWVDAQLELESARSIDARLSKRYAVPFASPPPIAVKGWLSKIVTLSCWLKRGVDAGDEQFVEYKAQAESAAAEIKEAADSNEGLFDLPLRADTTASGISKGGPRSYSEQSPYVFTDRQSDVGHQEDRSRGGTSS